MGLYEDFQKKTGVFSSPAPTPQPQPTPQSEGIFKKIARAVLPKFVEDKIVGPKPSAPVPITPTQEPKITGSIYDQFKSKTGAFAGTPVLETKPTLPTPGAEKDDGKNFAQEVAEKGLSLVGPALKYVLDKVGKVKNFYGELNFDNENKMREMNASFYKERNLPVPDKYKPYATKEEYEADAPIVKALNTKTGKKIVTTVARESSGSSILARIKSLGDDTYQEAYDKYQKASENPDNPEWKKFLINIGNTGPQTAIGVLLSVGLTNATKSPAVGTAVSTAYFGSLSADEQLREKGKVSSLLNIGIDTVGDQLLGRTIEGLFKQPAKALVKSMVQSFGIEGGTEVSQTLLKLSNDYANAKTDQEKQDVIDKAKGYVLSGDMIQEFLVGGVIGAGVAAGGFAVSKMGGSVDTSQLAGGGPTAIEAEPGSVYDQFKKGDLGPAHFGIEQKFANAPEDQIIGEFNKDIQSYQSSGISFEGDQQPLNASLLRLQEFSNLPAVQSKTKLDVEKAIQSKELPVNDDGTITVFRAGAVPEGDRLTSVAFTRQAAEDFVAGQTSEGVNVPIAETQIDPGQIKVFIGGSEKEILLSAEDLRTALSKTPEEEFKGKLPKETVFYRGGGQAEVIKPRVREAAQQVKKTQQVPGKREGLFLEAKTKEGLTITKQDVVNAMTGRATREESPMRDYTGGQLWIKLDVEDYYSIPEKLRDTFYKNRNKFPVKSSYEKAQNEELNFPKKLEDKLNVLGEKARNQTRAGKFELKQTSKGFDVITDSGVFATLESTAPKKAGTEPSFSRGDLADLVKASPEFAANPTFEVIEKDGDKYLSYDKGKMKFTIQANALGLKVENLKIGDVITLDAQTLKAKGKGFVVNKYEGGTPSGYASAGGFAENTTVELGHLKDIKPIELPELVDLARELMGSAPEIKNKVSRHFGGTALGVFIGKGEGEIRLRADLFNPKISSPDQAAKTLAHEIGHLADWLPTKNLKRGNLLARLLTLEDFRKNTFEDIIATDKELRTELKALTQYWKPFDDQDKPSFTRYRYSAPELYADAISVLFNSPGTVEKMAPKFYNTFFEQLDQKAEVKDAYFEIQSLLSGERIDVIAHRRAGVQEMFNTADYKAKDLEARKRAEREEKKKNLFFRFKFEVVDRNQKIIDKVNELKKQGKHINPDDDPRYTLEERNYLGGKIKAIFERDFQPVYEDLVKNDITWTQFGEGLFYERIISGDRSDIANPRGLTPTAVNELYEALQTELGPERVKILQEQMVAFRGKMRAIADEAFNEGLYKPELYEKMRGNPSYVTFQVLDHIDEGVSAKIAHQIGTLKDINNPANSSLLKMIATIRAIERNKVSRSVIDFMESNFSDEIEESKYLFTGKVRIPLEAIKAGRPDRELITVYRDGSLKGHYVDPYIATSINRDSVGQNSAVIQTFRLFNTKFFRPLFITFNVGFQSFNLWRDFWRYYKASPTRSLLGTVKRYIPAIRPALVRGFGLKEGASQKNIESAKLIQQMEYEQVLSTTYNHLIMGQQPEDLQIDAIMRQVGLREAKTKDNIAMKALRPILNFISNLGDAIETIPKAAGYYELKDQVASKEMRSYIRRKVGSPDFLAGGHITPNTNAVFLFSNAIIQGIRSDIEVATDPKTRAGYWWKTAKINFLPKLVMYAAAAGFLGDWLKEAMDGVSEYDKTNYIVVPFWVNENGKTIYLRIPQDETGRLFAGIFWKGLTAFSNDQGFARDAIDVVSLLGGQVPSLSPIITSGYATSQFITGANPYDFFRGRNVLTDDQYKAGGWDSISPFLGWQWEQLGGGIFMKFYSNGVPPAQKTAGEKILAMPLVSNIVGRWIRVSDYGLREKYRAQLRPLEQEAARRRLKEKEVVNKYVEKFNEDKNGALKLKEYHHQIVTELLGHEPENKDELADANRLVKKFKLARTKSLSDPRLTALLDAPTNDEKKVLLKAFKSDMNPEKFKELMQKIKEEELVSPEVFHSVSK